MKWKLYALEKSYNSFKDEFTYRSMEYCHDHNIQDSEKLQRYHSY